MRRNNLLVISCVLALIHGGCWRVNVHGSVAEYRLVKRLLKKYDSNVRPVERFNDTIHVFFGVDLIKLIDLDERHQRVTLHIWKTTEWRDMILQWNPSEYENITEMSIKQLRVWRPDVVLYSQLFLEETVDIKKYNESFWARFNQPLVATYKGDVRLRESAVIKSTCTLDVRYFPWDLQVCPFKFSSWSNDMTRLRLKNTSATASTIYFRPHGEWDLLGMPAINTFTHYEVSEAPFAEITFWLVIRRRGLYYVFNLIIPSLFLMMVAFLAFILPPASGEKVALIIGVLLALVVFLLMVAESMPEQSTTVPLLGIFYAAAMGILAMSALLTVVVINLHYHGHHGRDVPTWLQLAIMHHVAKLIIRRSLMEEAAVAGETPDKDHGKPKGKMARASRSMPPSRDDPANLILCEISNNVDCLMKRLHHQTTRDTATDNWMRLAAVVDRFFFLCLVGATVVSVFAVMYNRPTFTENAWDYLPAKAYERKIQ